MKVILFFYILVLNCASFFLCAYDKRAARRRKWRVPERTLFLFALLGGGTGLYLGMLLVRHKTRHMKFMIGVPLVILLNLYLYARLFQFVDI